MTRARTLSATAIATGAFVCALAGCRADSRPVDEPVVGPVEAESPARGAPVRLASSATGERQAVEVEVARIPLSGPVMRERSEFSGLTWYGEYLILLPQYPHRFDVRPDGVESRHEGAIFAIPRHELATRIDGRVAATPEHAIEPQPITLVAPGLAERIVGYQGFEAIAFLGDQAFLTIESDAGDRMVGYLVRGRMNADMTTLTLDVSPDAMREIPAGADLSNASDESIIVAGDRILTLYEANGAHINRAPRAHVFDLQLGPLGTIPLVPLEYRVTDASVMDADGRFWVINYLYPVNVDKYRPAEDRIAARHGRGPTHRRSQIVERLVELRYQETGITLVDRPPVQLVLGDGGRNWEGLVRMGDDGFLIVTDTFPETMLGYVRMPADP